MISLFDGRTVGKQSDSKVVLVYMYMYQNYHSSIHDAMIPLFNPNTWANWPLSNLRTIVNNNNNRIQIVGLVVWRLSDWCLLVALCPSNMIVYLRDRSTQTFVPAATLR